MGNRNRKVLNQDSKTKSKKKKAMKPIYYL